MIPAVLLVFAAAWLDAAIQRRIPRIVHRRSIGHRNKWAIKRL
jgi:hypothetical protein